MEDKPKKSERISVRASQEQKNRVLAVADNIASESRGARKPDISEIIRSILGWENRELVSLREREFIAGDIPSIHGDIPIVPKSRRMLRSKSKGRTT